MQVTLKTQSRYLVLNSEGGTESYEPFFKMFHLMLKVTFDVES